MSTLFVIGNGFDMAHNLKTSYWCFMEYLKAYAEDFYYRFEDLYGYAPYCPDGFHSDSEEKLFFSRRTLKVYEGL